MISRLSCEIPKGRVPEIAPTLAVEVLSDSNTANEMVSKLREYFEAGTHMAWVIDPPTRKRLAGFDFRISKRRCGAFHKLKLISVDFQALITAHRFRLILHARNAPNIKINAETMRPQVPWIARVPPLPNRYKLPVISPTTAQMKVTRK